MKCQIDGCHNHFFAWNSGRGGLCKTHYDKDLVEHPRDDFTGTLCQCENPLPVRRTLATECGRCYKGIPEPEARGQMLVISL